MGIYQEHVLPHFQDVVMGRKPVREVHARVCEGLRGEVVEIGFGTGLNARYYPAEVTKVLAVEPSKVCMRLAEPRIARTPTAVEFRASPANTSTSHREASTQCSRPGPSARSPTWHRRWRRSAAS